jgi:The GLUG motif
MIALKQLYRIHKRLFFIPLSCLFFSCSVIAATKITNCTELQNMILNLSDSYVLANDVDCSGFNFIPVGSVNTPFTGTLDGMGYKISNLSISLRGTIGLFGVTKGATIGQLNLDNVKMIDTADTSGGGALIGDATSTQIYDVTASGIVNITGSAGGLVGLLNESSSLKRSSSSVNVSSVGTGSYVGGLVGQVYDRSSSTASSITDSYATGSVKGSYSSGAVGGLVGELANGSITTSYATGEVGLTVKGIDGNGNFGGLVGALGSSPLSGSTAISIKSCYATGNVTGDNKVNTTQGETIGGLVGYVYQQAKSPSITNSFAIGNVSGAQNVGGLIGMNKSSSFQLSNSYSAGEVTATANKAVGGLVGYDDLNGKSTANSYWDTQNSGQTTSAGGIGKTTTEMYQKNTYVNWDFNNTWAIKEGVSYPTLLLATGIKSCTDLQAISKNLDLSYVLFNDIDCNGITFNPIGDATTPFTGSFNGNGHTISNLYIYMSLSSTADAGLFKVAKNANITNFILKNAAVSGYAPVGTVVGEAHGTQLSHISVDGSVTSFGYDYYIGGLVGYLSDGSVVKSSMSAASVNAAIDYSGFGHTSYVGGLVGWIDNGSQILNSYATGSVTGGHTSVGGLVGVLGAGTGALVSNTYSIGKVTATQGGTPGGLVGSANPGTVVNSYYNTETSGQSNSAGGVGKTTAQLYQQSTYVNWDFTNIWDINDGASYPWLRLAVELPVIK